MSEYTAHATTTATIDPDDEDSWDALIEVHGAAPHFAAFSTDTAGRLEVQLTVDAQDLPTAARRAELAVLTMLSTVGRAPGTELVALEVLTGDELARRVDDPPRADDLVSTSEVAEMLGVRRQRVLALAKRPDFPPAVPLGVRGKHFSRAQVRRFAATWDRTPGPKAKAATSSPTP